MSGSETSLALPMSEVVRVTRLFDYGELDRQSAGVAKKNADAIQNLLTRTATNIIEIGSRLIIVKASLPHGQWLPWLKCEFGWSQQHARNLMSVASKSPNFGDLDIKPSALYLLAQESTPDAAREEATRRAEDGEQITYTTAKQIIKESKWSESQSRNESLNGSQQPDEGCIATPDFGDLIESGVRWQTAYADPAWSYDNQGTRSKTDNHYRTMSVDEIAALPVRKIVADDAHLHLWTTNAFLFDAKKVMEAWGFEYRSVMVWVKPQMGIGNYWRVSHEFLLLGIRGDAKRFREHTHMSWVEHDRIGHSAKPDLFRRKIEAVSHGPYIELFARRLSPGWSAWGDQIEPNLFDERIRERITN